MTEKKQKQVEFLTAQLSSATGIYLADFTGITVPKVTELRTNFRAKGISMRVAKNTLLKRAMADAGVKGLDNYLAGPTALILSHPDDSLAPAKLIAEFQKKNEGLLNVKRVLFDGSEFDGAKIADLAKMPGKRELQAAVVQLALSPATNLIGLIKGPAGKVAGQIKALVEKLDSNSDKPEATDTLQ